jgi:hypothetical protein
VRNIAGVVSAALSKAVKWGLVPANPVHYSERPKLVKCEAVALNPVQERLMVASGGSLSWSLDTFLEVADATGARRGEVLALRWADVSDAEVLISRSLSQTKKGLTFKPPKNGKPRSLPLPPSTVEIFGPIGSARKNSASSSARTIGRTWTSFFTIRRESR